MISEIASSINIKNAAACQAKITETGNPPVIGGYREEYYLLDIRSGDGLIMKILNITLYLI